MTPCYLTQDPKTNEQKRLGENPRLAQRVQPSFAFTSLLLFSEVATPAGKHGGERRKPSRCKA